eukprot:GHVU01197006.1.p3 GENE.GHVU01197006.1~~GHVU01197006.1.p3  ORF type:complete len:106 (+),score=11.59 GHVU01197006.1:866-1183(+)
MWPLVLFGVGIGAAAARQGLRAIQRSNVKVPDMKPLLAMFSRSLEGFDSSMSRSEACKILNVNIVASKDKIRDAHRTLMLKNHPDNGGSNFVASKVNEAKDALLR